MQWKNVNKGVKGSLTIQNRALRFAYMIKEEAKRRARILTFWQNHGLAATMEAFKVSRPSLYRWQKNLEESGGKLEALNPKSRVPTKKRTRNKYDIRISQYIIEKRKTHPYGKKKLHKLIKRRCKHEWGIECPSESTIGRIINDLKERGSIADEVELSFYAKQGVFREKRKRKKRKKQRRKGYIPEGEGDLVEIDTIEMFVNGIKRYIITAIDLHGRFAFARAYKTASSASATDFMKKLMHVAPFKISHIQTDNGSEFEKHFRKFIEETDIVHFHIYPRQPKMNSHIERFNQTIQKEFANKYRYAIAYDFGRFQILLTEWLIEYNTERPHESLDLMSPMEYFCKQLTTKKSQMLWTRTKNLHFVKIML